MVYMTFSWCPLVHTYFIFSCQIPNELRSPWAYFFLNYKHKYLTIFSLYFWYFPNLLASKLIFSPLSWSESAMYIIFYTSFQFVLPLWICNNNFGSAESTEQWKKNQCSKYGWGITKSNAPSYAMTWFEFVRWGTANSEVPQILILHWW